MNTKNSLVLKDDGEYFIEQSAIGINPQVKGFLLKRCDPSVSAGLGYECIGWFGMKGASWTGFIDIQYDKVRDADIECVGCYRERGDVIERLWEKRHEAHSVHISASTRVLQNEPQESSEVQSGGTG